jgi:hypothetical protein
MHQEAFEGKSSSTREVENDQIRQLDGQVEHKDPKWLSDKNRTRIVIFGFLATLVVELITQKLNINSPSYYGEYFATVITNLFVSFGNSLYCAFNIISSYCNIKDVAQGLYKLLWLIFIIPMSPYYTFLGIKNAIVSTGIQESVYTMATGLIVLSIVLTLMEINFKGLLKPSSWLEKTRMFVTACYKYFGRFISDLSSYYRILNLEKFIEAFVTLLYPIHQIIIAPIWSTIEGYIAEVKKYRYGVVIISFGTGTLALLASYGFTLFYQSINDAI